MEKKIVYFSVAILMISLMAVSVASAGFLDKFVTGKATSQLTNVTVDVIGINPIDSVTIDAMSDYTPIEAGLSGVPATVRVSDPDGANDVDRTSVKIWFSRAGEATRSDLSCAYVNIESNEAVFLCNVSMEYYDLNAADWSAVATATDYGNGTYVNSTAPVTFTYNLLKAMTISPSSIAWGSLDAGATDQSATNDPTTITNTGNYNDTVSLTGLTLLGTNLIDEFPAADFAVSVSDPACAGQALANASLITVTNSISSRGPGATEEFYYCIPAVPNLPTQEYSTANAGGSWIVSY